MDSDQGQPFGAEGGFIKIYRRVESWPLWRQWNATQRWVWIQMLLEANWKPSEIQVKEGRHVIHRGEFVTSQAVLAKKAGATRKVVRTVYRHLEAEGAIRLRKIGTPLVGRGGGHQVVAVTIVNYCRYQDKPEDVGHQGATKGPHQKNGKKVKNKPSRFETQNLNTLPPSDTRGEGRVIKLNPDDALSVWDPVTETYVPRGLTALGRTRIGRG